MPISSEELYAHFRQSLANLVVHFPEDPDERIAKLIGAFGRVPEMIKDIGVDSLTVPIPNEFHKECDRLTLLITKYHQNLWTYKDDCDARGEYHLSNDPEIGVDRVCEALHDLGFVSNQKPRWI